MQRIISFARSDFDALRNHVLRSDAEEAAFLIAGSHEDSTALNLLVKGIAPVPSEYFIHKGAAYLSIDPEFFAPLVKRCKLKKLSLILAHSHPFSGSNVSFSSIDDRGEEVLFPKIQRRIPDRPLAGMVFGRSSVDARVWHPASNSSLPVNLIRIVGSPVENIRPTSSHVTSEQSLHEIHDRQILAFGESGQRSIQSARPVIVGLGGVGSQVFQQLVHLGVRRMTIVDYDKVEESNLSRIVGSIPDDAKQRIPKVKVMERLGKQINPTLEVTAIDGSVYDLSVAMQILGCDVIFCCTDSFVSRMVLNRIAYQYLIPMIDMGIDIQCSDKGKIRSAAGRVMIILPDGPCLQCLGIIDTEALSSEVAQLLEGTPVHRQYITGVEINNPSVISLNGVIASLAVTEFINLITGFQRQRDVDTYQTYRVLKGTVQLDKMEAVRECTLCKEVKSLGDSVELPCRLDR